MDDDGYVCIIVGRRVGGKLIVPLTPEEEERFRQSADALRHVISNVNL